MWKVSPPRDHTKETFSPKVLGRPEGVHHAAEDAPGWPQVTRAPGGCHGALYLGAAGHCSFLTNAQIWERDQCA